MLYKVVRDHKLEEEKMKKKTYRPYFVFMLIILTSLVSTNKIQKTLCSIVRLVRMISTKGQKNNFLVAIYEYGLYTKLIRGQLLKWGNLIL